MATTSNTHIVGGSGQAGPYSYSFPILADADVKVRVNNDIKSVTTHYTLDSSNTRITFVSGQEPSTGDKVIVYRDTDEDPINSTFVSGSTIRSNELNDNFSQLLYIAQESDNQSLSKLGGVMEGDVGLGLKTKLYFEGDTDNAHETTLTVVDPTADRTITFPDTTGTVVTTGDTGTVTSTMITDATIVNGDIANTTITGGKLVNDTITATQIAANAVTASELADDSVDRAAIVADAVDGTKIADNAINSEHYTDGSIDAAHFSAGAVDEAAIANGNVTRAKIAADAIDQTKIADDSIAAEHISANAVGASELANNAVDTAAIVDNAVTNSKISANAVQSTQIEDNAVTTAKIANDAITSAKIGDNQVTNSAIADNAIQTTQLADDAVTAAKIGDLAVLSNHIGNLNVTTGKIADDAVTTAKLADNAVTTAKIADAELSTLAGMQSGTASKLADSTALTADIADLNLLDGKSIVTTIGGNATDAQLASAQAINERIVELVTEVGGFHPIANETSFPSTNPDINDGAGTIVSIKALSSAIVCGSGVTTKTIANGAGSGNTVTINGLAQNTTYPAGRGMLVETTSTLHTYTYHRLTLDESGVADAQSAIDDFQQRYRVASSAPSSSLDDGDLYFDTTANKMKVYNATSSSWDDVATPGNFFITTLSSYSGTGGNSATFNNNAYRFVLSNTPNEAQQLLVSINGVIQKPNSGTSQPSEGFAVDGSSILFSSAPASGSDYFIVTIGSAVNIGTPSNNTVTTAILQNGSVTTAKIADDAITGDKLANEVLIPDNNKIKFGADGDLRLYHDGSNSHVTDQGTGNLRLSSNAGSISLVKSSGNSMGEFIVDGAVELYHNGNKRFETTSGGVSITGTTTFSDSLLLGDDVRFKVGTGADLQLYHNGTHSYITNATNDLNIECATSDAAITLKANAISLKDESNQFFLKGIENTGAVELYYGNAKKAESVTGGFTVTGTCTATAFAGDGSNLTGLSAGVSSDSQSNTVAGTEAGDSFSGTDANGNALFGYQAGTAITTGDYNVAIGRQALKSSTTSSQNVAIGTAALHDNVTGGNNTAVGSNALQSNTAGNNTACGNAALTANTSGTVNTAVGSNALDSNTTGGGNVAVGAYSMDASTTAVNNVAVGTHALEANTTGTYNAALGYRALDANTTASYNTALGAYALTSNTTGADNTAIGHNAASAVTSATNTVAIGKEACKNLTSGGSNVAVGRIAMKLAVGAEQNVAVGDQSMYHTTSGARNTAIGYRSLYLNTTSNNNVAVGYDALKNQTTGTSNTAVGKDALLANTTGNSNCALGIDALTNNTTGHENVAIGQSAMNNNQTGSGCVGVGHFALYHHTTGGAATALGYKAAYDLTTGTDTVAIGNHTLQNCTTGSFNTALGHAAGDSCTTGQKNTFLGYHCGENITTGGYNVMIGSWAADGVTTGSSNVCIGPSAGTGQITSDNNTLWIARDNGTNNTAGVWIHGHNNGACYQGNDSTAWTTSSDVRLKKDITDYTTGLSVINQVRVRNYKHRTYDEIDLSTFPTGTTAQQVAKQQDTDVRVGIIADELQTIAPRCVSVGRKGVKAVDTDELFWDMINAIKELSTKNDALAARIATLEAA